MRNSYLFPDFILADIYRIFLGENHAHYADYFTDCNDAWHFAHRYYFDVLYRRRVYRYDTSHQPRTSYRAFYGERIVWQVGALDLENSSVRVCVHCPTSTLRRTNRLLTNKKLTAYRNSVSRFYYAFYYSA